MRIVKANTVVRHQTEEGSEDIKTCQGCVGLKLPGSCIVRPRRNMFSVNDVCVIFYSIECLVEQKRFTRG